MWCSERFTVVSEPFLDLYKKSLQSRHEHLSVLTKVRSACRDLTRLSSAQPVFVKEMAYHAEPFVSDTFLGSINNTILIRDPSLSIPSLYKMRTSYAERETGFRGQIDLFNRVKNLTGTTPLVVDAEQLRASAEPVVREYFAFIGEVMPPDILTWSIGSRAEWADREAWHTHAIKSAGFEPATGEKNLSGLPEKVSNSIRRNRPYYEEMKTYIDQPAA